jgi:hypothetical protein
MVTSKGIIASVAYTKKKGVSPMARLEDVHWPTVHTEVSESTWHHASSSSHRCAS